MSWWNITGEKDSFIGDRPADIIGTALQDIASTWEQQTTQSPTLQQLLDWISAILRINFENYCCDAMGTSIQRIGIRLEENPDIGSEGVGIDTAHPLVVRLSDALTNIVQLYEEGWERKPRLIELLKNLEFVLASEDYLLNGEAVKIEEIFAQLDPEVTSYWWKLTGEDNIIGYQPSEIVAAALAEIASTYEQERGQRPTVQDLSSAMASALNTHLEEFCIDGSKVSIERVDIKLDFEDEPISSQVANTASEQLVVRLCDALTEVVKIYQDKWGRKPKIRELLKTIRFVLVAELPAKYLSVESYREVNDVTAQLGKKFSWWDIGNDCILSERATDIMKTALEAIARTYKETREPNLTLQKLVDAIASTLNTKPEEFCSDIKEVSVQTVLVILDAGSNLVSNPLLLKADEEIVISLYNTFEEIANIYQEKCTRKPRLKELLETIKFVLASKPGNYISIANNNSIKDIVASVSQEDIIPWKLIANVGFVSYKASWDMREALKEIVRLNEEQEKRPARQDIVDAIAATLRINLEKICSDSKEVSCQRLVIRLEDKLPLVSNGENKTADDPLVIGFSNAFKEIAKIYEERWQRKPRLKEVLTILTMSLESSLGYSVSDADGEIYIDDIVVE